MEMDADLSKERQVAAREAIKSLYGKPQGKYGPTLFVSHHLEEIEPEYWLRTVGVPQPSPEQVLEALVFMDAWTSGSGDTVNTFDFRLPGNVTNYLLSVRFLDDGHVQYVSMES